MKKGKRLKNLEEFREICNGNTDLNLTDSKGFIFDGNYLVSVKSEDIYTDFAVFDMNNITLKNKHVIIHDYNDSDYPRKPVGIKLRLKDIKLYHVVGGELKKVN